ncbi:glutamate racemase [Nitratiruptor sp. YY08-26]|uniref:glutamate racemase n=1 Tax=unclassified Nitratiruptor TaxID=2624044 RepID=UPI001915090C|nr:MULTISPECIES: glutamate racemase [unclassified Nitratiruptor]BCD62735.1 glutamate racemase [Nitratiruptor sp. YY08-13]BCD66671.1 glutamate racemase [Nitratiruptor sp. YY08-26]
MRAAVFDSGIGGLTVVKSLLAHKLFDEIIYFGDTARVPYGPKDKNTIIRYSLEALEFFKNFEPDILITACNSVSAHAIEELREVAPFPVVGVIEPGVLALEKKLQNKKSNILIIGTKATIESQKYQHLLLQRGYTNLTAKATPLFVPIVEEEIFEGEILKATMHHYFQDLHPKAIILGCTHFPLITRQISSYFYDKALLIHSGEAIVEHLENTFHIKKSGKTPSLKLFASENPEKLKRVAARWLSLSQV